MDSRREALRAVLCSPLGGFDVELLSAFERDDAAVASFLDNSATMGLQARVESDNNVALSNTIEYPDGSKGAVVLTKQRDAGPLTPESIRELSVTVMRQSPLASLFNAVRDVYGPMLLQDNSWSSRIDAGLRSALESLDGALASTLQSDNSGQSVHTPTQEFEFWQKIADGRSQGDKEAATQFSEFFSTIKDRFIQLENKGGLSAEELLELIEATYEAFDDVWKCTDVNDVYPQPRMQHLLGLVGNAIVGHVEHQLSQQPLWESSVAVDLSVRECLRLLEAWQRKCELLVRIWGSYGLHRWDTSRGIEDGGCGALLTRLQEISDFRATHSQLLQLLTAEEQKGCALSEVWGAFAGVQCLQCNNYATPLWDAAKSQLCKRRADAEQQGAQALRAKFKNLKDNKRGLLRATAAFEDVIKLPTVAALLASERQTLLSELRASLVTIRDEFEDRTSMKLSNAKQGGGIPCGKYLPEVVATVVWARQLRNRVVEVGSTAEKLLADLVRLDSEFTRDYEDAIENIEFFEQEKFESWQDEVMQQLDDPDKPLALQMKGQLMEIDYSNQMLKVGYNSELVSLIREVRQLMALGYDEIPKEITKAADDAQQYYRHAVVLNQVANFYNNIDNEIIPSQKMLLFKYAVAFEQVVKNPAAGKSKNKSDAKMEVTWEDPKQLKDYVRRLKDRADKLSTANRQLKGLHTSMIKDIVQLMSISLLQGEGRKKWFEKVEEMRSQIKQVGAKYGDDNVGKWVDFLNHQMYKALEHQYQMGLESLNESLPEIKCELVFRSRDKSLEFREPADSSRGASSRGSLEQLRARFHRELKTFICLPCAEHFSLGGAVDIFTEMPMRNVEGLRTVYAKGDALFNKLDLVRSDKQQLCSLGWVTADELEDMLEKSLVEVNDWKKNFDIKKQKERELDKMPNNLKVDCFLVSTLQLKDTVEGQLQNLSESLIRSLRKKMIDERKVVDSWLDETSAKLQVKPSSVDELSEAQRAVNSVADSKSEMEQAKARVGEKVKLLKQYGGSNKVLEDELVQMESTTAQKWSSLENMLGSFNEELEAQRDTLRNQISGRVEECMTELSDFAQKWSVVKPKSDAAFSSTEAESTVTRVNECKIEFDKLTEGVAKLQGDCEAFELEKPTFTQMDDLKEDIEKTEAMWAFYTEFSTALDEVRGKQWITYRVKIFQFEDFLNDWGEKVRSRGADAVSLHVQKQIDTMRRVKELLRYCSGESFEKEHWATLYSKLGLSTATKYDDLVVGDFLDVQDEILNSEMALKELHARAQGEVVLREALQELRVWAQETEFTLVDHECDGGRPGTHLIREWKDTLSGVGDNQALLQSLKESPFYPAFANEANGFETKLAALDDYLHSLNQIQRKWVYLEPIFGRGALPQEQGRFKRVDDEYRNIMSSIAADSRVMSLCMVPGLKEQLPMMLDQLERCQKALAEFLEQKRQAFPRFYFLGDDDLLEILGQAKNPVVIQSHLKKLFAAINKVGFGEGKKEILAMLSQQGEEVPLKRPVLVNDLVEEWLSDLADQMKSTLGEMLHDCLAKFDLRQWPSQILTLAENLSFCIKCNKAIVAGALPGLITELNQRLEQYTSIPTTGDPVLFLKLKSLIFDLIHNIEVAEACRDNPEAGQNRDVECWQWQKQLRYRIDPDRSCAVLMCDAAFLYTNEYQGNSPRLVHTPLTDKCYLTLTQGMKYGFGGNPYGPAGTGKTESVKALGQAFGRQVLVFNCDEGIDFQAMGRIFVGLVKCGGWGCFDEFNRLKEDQLSAISQQIQLIQAALKERLPSVELLGKPTSVDFNAGIFVTLNPAGKGYGGRSELPDNLKQLFRAISMAKPDNNLIAEVELFAEGLKNAKLLARRVVSIFTLSKQLLSAQQHYDWGLRALKTVLRTSGTILSKHKTDSPDSPVTTELENQFVIQALRMNTLSKLTFADSQRFSALVEDVFPGVSASELAYPELASAIEGALTEMKLGAIDLQRHKMLQFNECLQQRMGVVLVGPSGCGKSTIWKVLRNAKQRLGQTIKLYVMNPKAMARQRLLGHMDLDTREWFDGVLTAAARQVVKEDPDVQSWIVCDGDIDPEWVESLNSVLDDNKLLTMPNGERISFGPNVNFIFETHDLCFASPATVSRMGMIFLSDEDMSIPEIVNSWLVEQDEDRQSMLGGWLDMLFQPALDLAMQCETLVPTTTGGIVVSGLSQLSTATTKAEFVLSLIRGLTSNIESADERAKITSHIFMMAKEQVPDPNRPLDSCIDSYGNLATFQPNLSLPDDADVALGLPMVNTIGVQRTLAVINPWLLTGQPFIVCGPEGAGKSMMLQYAFSQCKSLAVATVHCNAQTTSENVIQKLNLMCSIASTNSGRVYRPKESEKLVLYLRDLNLPRPDMYDTVELLAFLQQLLTHGGFYDDQLEFIRLERVQVVVSMTPSNTVGRHPLTTRFTAITRIAAVTYPDAQDLVQVYSTLLQSTLMKIFPTGSSQLGDSLARMMVDLYVAAVSKFSVDEQRHYQFTPRNLSQWVAGLMRYEIVDNDELLEVVVYECRRIFCDRLVSAEAVAVFDGMLNQMVYRAFQADLSSFAPKFYSTWANTESGNSRLGSIAVDDARQLVDAGIASYEREFKLLNLLLLDDVLAQLARLDRVLSDQQGNGSLLLVGSTGIGRRAMVTLATSMLRMEYHSPAVGVGFGLKAFHADLKTVMTQAGVNNEQVVYFVEDHQLEDPACLESINSLLSAGELPGLYTSEELDTLLAPLRDEMGAEGKHRTLYSFFTSRVVRNLRVVLSLDPSNPDFLVRCESNPALYTRCAIMWLDRLSKETLQQLPHKMLSDISATLGDGMDHQANLFSKVHTSMVVSKNASPLHYYSFLSAYNSIYQSKQKELEGSVSHLQSGLSKLSEAAQTVDTLSADAGKKQIELGVAQKKADEALTQITAAMESAGARKTEVEQLRSKLAEEETTLNARKSQVEGELSQIQPMLDSAKKAVGNINPANLSEIKSLKMPPEPIRDVLEGVLRLMGNYDTSWISMKRFIGNRGVLAEIMNFDASNIDPKIRQGVEDILRSKSSSFQHDVIKRVSVAAAPLAQWVVANVQYSHVMEQIAPMREELARASESLEISSHRLQECEEELATLDERVAELKAEFGKRTGQAERLKASLEDAETTLNAAQNLLGKLTGEKSRWDISVQEIKNSLQVLPQQTMVVAAFVTYLGSAAEDVRTEMLEAWFEVCNLEKFDVLRWMCTESELLQWRAAGLPGDQLSMENAVAILHSVRSPLLIDPTMQASNWLKDHLKEKGQLEVVNQHDPRFVNTLELSVRFGKTMMVEEVTEVSPLLFPILRRDFTRQGPRWMVQIGDKIIDYNEDFQLFMTTRNPSIVMPPDASPLVNEVNFSVTRAGLEGQLLSFTIHNEKPELEEEKSRLLKQEEDLKVELASLEQSLLETLATSEGNILENVKLLDSLNETKVKSDTIKEALQKSKQLAVEIDSERSVFAPIAVQGSKMYFLIEDLKHVSHMYQFSLPVFLAQFKKILEVRETSNSSVEQRISLLTQRLQQVVFRFILRSLFKADRLTFALHYVHGLFPQAVDSAEWSLFRGESTIEPDARIAVPAWISTDRMQATQQFLSVCPSLANALGLENFGTWDRWHHSGTPEAKLPDAVHSKLSAFQRLLTVQALRPDRIESAMSVFVCEMLGMSSLAPASGQLMEIYENESSATEYILMVTTPGADPSQELEEFARSVVGADNFAALPMGGDQAEAAITMVRSAARSGGWVCLKNMHLVVGWIPELEKELNNLTPTAGFRLWLTTEPHRNFSVMLLRSSLKVTYEAPPGLRANLTRTYEGWASPFVEKGQPMRAQLLFVLSWFHAVVQERRTYIPAGWRKFYEFSPSDLRIGVDILESAIARAEGKQLQWDYIHGLLELAVYGGKIDDVYDINVLRTYIENFFNLEVLSANGASGKRLTRSVAVPKSARFTDYTELIAGLGHSDTPLLFGLPDNIDRAVQQVNANHVFSNLKHMLLSAVSLTGFDREQWRSELGPILKLWSQLLNSNPDVLAAPPAGAAGNATPIESFVLLESNVAFKTLEAINNSLHEISEVIEGRSLMTNQVMSHAKSLMGGEVPDDWAEHWEGTEKVQPFMRLAVGKTAALRGTWLDRMASKSLLKAPVVLAQLFRPQNFLNALRQQAARSCGVSMDALTLITSTSSALLDQYMFTTVEGLLLQGALLEDKLKEVNPDSPLLSEIPVVAMAWVPDSDAAGLMSRLGHIARIPMYTSPTRDELVAEIMLPCSSDASQWAISGTVVCLSGE